MVIFARWDFSSPASARGHRGNKTLIHAPVTIEFPMTFPDPTSHLFHNLYLSIVPTHGFQACFNLCEECIAFVGHETSGGCFSIRPESKAIGVALQCQPCGVD